VPSCLPRGGRRFFLFFFLSDRHGVADVRGHIDVVDNSQGRNAGQLTPAASSTPKCLVSLSFVARPRLRSLDSPGGSLVDGCSDGALRPPVLDRHQLFPARPCSCSFLGQGRGGPSWWPASRAIAPCPVLSPSTRSAAPASPRPLPRFRVEVRVLPAPFFVLGRVHRPLVEMVEDSPRLLPAAEAARLVLGSAAFFRRASFSFR